MKWTDPIDIVSLCSLCLPIGLLIWHSVSGRWANLHFALFFAGGLLLSQLFHSFIFFRQEWQTLTILPDGTLSASSALKLSLLLFSVAYVAMSAIRTHMVQHPLIFGLFALGLILVSQFVGRGLIKFGFEASMGIVTLLALYLARAYGSVDFQMLSATKQDLIYAELWEILKISVPVVLFYLGTVGATFAIQFLREQYFRGEGPMAQLQMFRYGVMFIYTACGIAFLLYAPLLKWIFALRQIKMGGP